MTTFAELKKSKNTNLDTLTKELENLDKKTTFAKDDRLWSLTVDKAGNGHAIIRFLPASAGEDLPWVRIWDHGFQGPTGQWYIEKSLTTLNRKDPVSEYNSKLWATGLESNKDICRKQKRRLSYYSNIYVVSDPANPDNEGKVFIFKYGQKIFDKIKDLMNPQFEGEKAVDPFHLWEGANFKLRAKQVAGYRNYDSSEFTTPGPLLNSDSGLEKIWNSQYSLQSLISLDQFKSYEELQARLNIVLGGSAGSSNDNENDEIVAPATGRIREERSFPTAESKIASSMNEDEEDGLEFFAKLVE